MTTLQSLQKYLQEIKKNDQQGKKINAFLQLNPNAIQEAKAIDAKNKKGKLAGKIIAIKANINVKGMNTSCASKTLKNYKAPYNATVIEKIKAEEGLIIGITNMDEFASGSSGESSAFGATKNPAALEYIPGGSSSGSCAAVSANFCDIALGSDTGGSIRQPASNCNVIGLKPTYSAVSRYGLIDLSMSLDQIGPVAKNINDCALMYSIIYGKDKKDSISQESKFNLKEINKKPKQLIIGLLDLSDLKINKEIQDLIKDKTKKIAEKNNWKIKKIKIPNLDIAVETYYPLVYVEFFSATRRFDGRRYGKKIEDSCGKEVLRRILGGQEIAQAEYAGRYYHKALKAKKFFERRLQKAFEKVDCIISPISPKLPHKLGEKISIEEMYAYDALTIPYNLYGNCAISVPAGRINNLPVGIQIACDKFQETKLFQIAKCFENIN